MLTLIDRAKIASKKKMLGVTTRHLAVKLNIPYSSLASIIAGKYNQTEYERKIIEWVNADE